MQRLARAARESNCAIVLIHHAGKVNGTYRDSTEIGAGVDVIIEIEPLAQDREDTGLRRLRPRGRIPDLAPFEVQFNGTSFSLANGGAAPLSLRVLNFVKAHEGCSQSHVRTAVGARKDDVRRELTALINAGLIADLADAKGSHFHAIHENTGPGAGPGSHAGPNRSGPGPEGLTPAPGPSGPYVIGGPRDPRRDPDPRSHAQNEEQVEADFEREGMRLP